MYRGIIPHHQITAAALVLTVVAASANATPASPPSPHTLPPTVEGAVVPQSGGGLRFESTDRPPALDDRDVERAANAPGPRLVRLEGAPRDAWRAAIAAAGGRIIQYLPVDTLLVWTTAGRIAESAIARLPFVRWVGPLPARDVMSPKLAAGGEVPRAMDLLVIDDGDLGATLAAVRDAGGRVVEHYPAQTDGLLQHVVVMSAPAAAPGLARIPTVLWIEPSPAAPDLAGEMASAVNAGLLAGTTPQLGYRAWLDDLDLDGAGVVWSVVDSGIDHSHPDFGPFTGVNYPSCETDPPGDDLVPVGHGTAVAGLIAGTGAGLFGDDLGFAYGLGVAPGVSLVSQNAVCGEGAWPPTGGWPRLARDAVAAGAVGSNNSWNAEIDLAYGIMEREFDVMVRDADLTTAARAEPLIIVFSAGNSGPDAATAKRPAAAKNIIVAGAVGTSRDGSSADVVADFSSRGPALDGRIVPTVVAPGEGVAATRDPDARLFGVFAIPDTEGRYLWFDGTSAAAPHVSGSLAVLIQQWRRRHGGRDPSPAMAKAMLVNRAVDIAGSPPVPNADEGWGRVDLGAMVRPPARTLELDQEHGLDDTGATFTLDVVVPDPAQPLVVTLAWSDAPAAPGADPALVNDLDLLVETNGTAALGNAASQSTAAVDTTPDRLNNVEQVRISQPGATARVTITAYRIAGDGVPLAGDASDQDFALVCSNCNWPPPPPRPAARRVVP